MRKIYLRSTALSIPEQNIFLNRLPYLPFLRTSLIPYISHFLLQPQHVPAVPTVEEN